MCFCISIRIRRTPIDINTRAERDAVCLALFHAGYTVRQRRRKDGNKTVIYIEYTRDMKER